MGEVQNVGMQRYMLFVAALLLIVPSALIWLNASNEPPTSAFGSKSANESWELVPMKSVRGPLEPEKVLVIYSMFVPFNATLQDMQILNFYFFTHIGTIEDLNVEFLFLMAADDPEREQKAFLDPDHPVWSKVVPPWLKDQPNVKLMWMSNGLYDLCQYSRLWKTEWFELHRRRFKKFIVLNSSVTGPIVHPNYAQDVKWTDLFSKRFNDSPLVAAVGVALSCSYHPHIQSYAIAMDERGLKIANETWYCPPKTVRTIGRQMVDWAVKTEVEFSRKLVKDRKLDFRTLLAMTYDWTGRSFYFEKRGCPGIHLSNYNGWYPTPYDAVFFKSSGFAYKAVPSDMWKALQVATGSALEALKAKRPSMTLLKYPKNPREGIW